MFLIRSINKLRKTTKIINAYSKGYVRSFCLCSCQAQNKVEFQNDKTNQEINKPPNLESDNKDDFIKIYRYGYTNIYCISFS